MKYPHKLRENIHLIVDIVGGVFIWRGIWQLLDTYFLPLQPQLSAIVGLLIGVVIILFLNDRV